MRYFVIVDNYGLLPALPSMAPDRDDLYFFTVGSSRIPIKRLLDRPHHAYVGNFSKFGSYKPTAQDRVMVHLHDTKAVKKIIKRIRALSATIPVLLFDAPVDNDGDQVIKEALDPGVTVLPIHGYLKNKSNEMWHQIEIKKRVERLRNAIDPEKPLWILVQNDPDPDAVASAMALQAVLGRTDRTASIVTLKPVSRNENISMIDIIGTSIRTVRPTELNRAPQIAMVDVQPPYFGFSLGNVCAVIDHHPVVEEYSVPYRDVQVSYGSTSTIFSEYLTAVDIKISQRLGTALYYGVKTDTLLLGRGVSHADFNAFALLWPKANHNQISQMERPRLQPEEIHVFVKALKNHVIERGTILVGLGKVPKDDLVPRLADFVLQLGETDFALVWGIVGKDITLSARSLTPDVHAGHLMRGMFGHLGSAGGHQTMARATMPLADLQKEYKTRSVKKMEVHLRESVLKRIAKKKREATSAVTRGKSSD